MRVKSEVAKSSAIATSSESTAPPTPDNVSVAESSGVNAEATAGENGENGDNADAASVATSATKVQPPKGKGDSKAESKAEKPSRADKSTSDNLVGRLTNLVTTDLSILQSGQSFMLLCTYCAIGDSSVWLISNCSRLGSDANYAQHGGSVFITGLEVSMIKVSMMKTAEVSVMQCLPWSCRYGYDDPASRLRS